MSVKTKEENRARRHHSIRKRITGTAERPRLVVFRSSKHIYAQIIDDTAARTLASASDVAKKKDGVKLEGDKSDRAKLVGAALAKAGIAKGIKKVVFDRGGYKYHGRVSAVAEGAREGGLEF